MNLTDSQQAILDFIAQRIEQDGGSPSQTEIANAFGFRGVRAAQYHLDILEQAGYIRRVPGQARSIRLCHPEAIESSEDVEIPVTTKNESADTLRLPVLGRVAAGLPIGADITGEDYVLLDRVFFYPSPDYLLRVQGDSMRDDGIFDGDLVGIHRTNEAKSDQIVVARIDDEITIKRLKIGKNGIRLLPRNPDFAPIEVRPDQDFAIEGLYCGLIRSSR
ncbi:MAG TPA: transcriptional repressor LexA [Arenimonas sp.]|nr:transcriptional repressor LexA [Arenimonas sp.]HOZ06387.1 transcriptional repressor LexA [Arenimonas sp.]HPW32947.1 transcriptional repressor LexA [Arenimonas sp.]